MFEECIFFYGFVIIFFFKWNGRFYKNLSIFVDLIVVFKVMEWEFQFDFMRLNNVVLDSFLRKILIEEIF